MCVIPTVETISPENGLISEIGPYKLESRIGIGAYGVVFSATKRDSRKVFAIKVFDKNKLSGKQLNKHVWTEAKMLSSIQGSRCIINLEEVLESTRYVHIVLEYIKGTDLQKMLRVKQLSEFKAKMYFKQLMEAVYHCHANNVVHRDIKPENILLSSITGDTKLIDFGFAAPCGENEWLTDPYGSPQYVAPEIFSMDSKVGYRGPPVDIWSAGVTLYELLTGRPPFECRDKHLTSRGKVNHLFGLIKTCDYSMEPLRAVSADAVDLVQKMLVLDPTKRLTAEEVLMHPWLNSITALGKSGEDSYRSTTTVYDNNTPRVGDYVFGVPIGRDYLGTMHSCVKSGGRTFKTIRAVDMNNNNAVLQLQKEVMVLGALDSEYIHKVEEILEDGEGGLYTVGDFVAGDTLQKKIRQGLVKRRSFNRIKYIRQLLSTLTFLHREGIVHRRINPYNICFDEEHDKMIVTGFEHAERSDPVYERYRKVEEGHKGRSFGEVLDVSDLKEAAKEVFVSTLRRVEGFLFNGELGQARPVYSFLGDSYESEAESSIDEEEWDTYVYENSAGPLEPFEKCVNLLEYQSPQELEGELHFGKPADVYAMGVVVYQLLERGALPNEPLTFKFTSDQMMIDMVKGMLRRDEDDRVTAAEAFRSPCLHDDTFTPIVHMTTTKEILGVATLRKHIEDVRNPKDHECDNEEPDDAAPPDTAHENDNDCAYNEAYNNTLASTRCNMAAATETCASVDSLCM
eukprot:TRINITY_DN16357_c0_g1_i1.p1 TRINITY_DN16357_c0_g1~~TRINITY_DN16357_c0_g1_i1.p1  ORF type:complete len:853 (+),score=296.70 TRINITY_DN16357_c0_g1_i1:343-2559(+)